MLKNIIYILSLSFISINLTGQTMTRAEYLEKYKEYAIKEMERTGIPASITIAQGMLESGDGNSRLAKKGNNHFGIKCHTWTGEKIHHDDDKNNECFRKYNSAYESYRDHSDFLVTTPRYKFLFELESKDYKGWAKGLKKAGYATSPVYAESLIRIIEENKLYLLDEGVDIKKQDIKEVKTKGTGGSTRELLENNRVKYIVAKEGETLESVAKELNLRPSQLEKYNEFYPGYIINAGQSVYIQPKRKNAEAGKKYHIVKEGETVFSISQMYAVKTSSIYLRNKIDDRVGIKPGQKLILRGRIPKNAENKENKEKEISTETRKPDTVKTQDVKEIITEPEEDDKMIFELDPE